MSLDGFIAGPNGEYHWIVMDPDIDFAEMMAQFDTFLIGRKTFDAMRRMGSDVSSTPSTQNIVFSRTLKPADYPNVTISADAERVVADLRTQPGKDIALFGGGELFRSLLAAGLVDGVGVSVIPVLLGGGFPSCPPRPGARLDAAKTPPLREDRYRRALVRHRTPVTAADRCGGNRLPSGRGVAPGAGGVFGAQSS